jgi:hypothetical protein
MPRITTAILLLFFINVALALGAPEKDEVPQWCKKFSEIDGAVRAAAKSGEAKNFADLIHFPLSVFRNNRWFVIKTKEEFIKNSENIFTPAVLNTILAERPMVCDPNQTPDQFTFFRFMYGPGSVWVEADNNYVFHITAVSVGMVAPFNLPSLLHPETLMKCITSENTVLVEDIGNKHLRYRSWKKGQALTSTPELTLLKGTAKSEGTQDCAYTIYRFEHDASVYEMQGLGCYTGGPKNAEGLFTVTHQKSLKQWWCRSQ